MVIEGNSIARGKSMWRQAATGKFRVHPELENTDIKNDIGKLARGSQCFEVQNVADYFYAKNGGEGWNIQKDYPCATPPFEQCWIEHGLVEAVGEDIVGVAALVISTRERDWRGSIWDESVRNAWNADPDSDGWILRIYLFTRWQHRGSWLCPITYFLHLDETGKPNRSPCGIPMFFPDEEENKTFNQAFALIHPILLTFSFLHCKNITTGELEDERRPSDRSRDLRAGIPEVKFKTIEIEPMRKVLATEGGIAQNGLKKALHICRGHFSEYSEEKPLFGKYSGRFWIPAHVRGTTESGQVIKDYKVKAPKGVAA